MDTEPSDFPRVIASRHKVDGYGSLIMGVEVAKARIDCSGKSKEEAIRGELAGGVTCRMQARGPELKAYRSLGIGSWRRPCG